MSKKITITILAFLALTVNAQHFDWVKSYSGQEPPGRFWNYIASSVTDSHGNLYVAGQFANGASIDGQDLLPFTPPDGQTENLNSCIMKISPQGNIEWKKILHCNHQGLSQIYDLQLVGDTALYANASIQLPIGNDGYLYFYDTLITQSNIGNLLYIDSLYYNGLTTAISVFNLEGTLTENYFLHMAYKDSTGQLITQDMVTGNTFDTMYIANQQFKPGPFTVDRHGNIYIGHISGDKISSFSDPSGSIISYDLQNGKIGEIVIMVNGRQRFCHAPISHPSTFNYRIMKFAPKFSSLLACRYIFDNEIGRWNYTYNIQITPGANDSNIYMLCNLASPTVLATENLNGDTSLNVLLNNIVQGVLIEYDSTLTPQNVYQIIPEQTTYEQTMWDVSFNKTIIEPDSNLLFILGTISKNNSNFNTQINGQNIDVGSSNAFFLKYNIGDSLIRTTGKARTDYSTYMITNQPTIGVVASKGRLFASTSYKNNIQWTDTSITLSNNQMGTGVYIWSYSGEEIDFIDLKKSSPNNVLSTSLAIHDSCLYISGGLADDIHIADTTITKAGNSIAYIFKYIDSTFDSIYSSSTSHNTCIINNEVQTQIKCYPNPTNSTIKIDIMDDEVLIKCRLINTFGKVDYMNLSSKTLDLSNHPTGIYYLDIITNKNIYKQKIIKI